MKAAIVKSILMLTLLTGTKINAQITYETTYNNSVYYDPLGLVHLSAAGYKYAICDSDQVMLYNLNHSLYSSFSIPNQPAGSLNYRVWYISDELFNKNPNDVEYVLTYETASTGIYHMRVYDQAGTLLFGRDTFTILNSLLPAWGLPSYSVQHTTAGTKMIIKSQYSSKTAIYALPGVLPCTMCDQGVMSGLQPGSGSGSQPQEIAAPYPNPTQSSITLPYALPQGTSSGEMIIYDIIGREVKRYSITNAFSTLVLETSEFAAGTYSYSIVTAQGLSPGNQFCVVR